MWFYRNMLTNENTGGMAVFGGSIDRDFRAEEYNPVEYFILVNISSNSWILEEDVITICTRNYSNLFSKLSPATIVGVLIGLSKKGCLERVFFPADDLTEPSLPENKEEMFMPVKEDVKIYE